MNGRWGCLQGQPITLKRAAPGLAAPGRRGPEFKETTTQAFGAVLAGLCVVLGTTPAPAADPPDLSKVDRRILREPAYKAKQPLYALYVFGPQAKTRVWAVLDKSKPDAPEYDVLYFDRNADGDLTASDERIE